MIAGREMVVPDRKLGALPRAWQTYRDDQLLLELARVTVSEVEPVIAHFVTEVIHSMPVGGILTRLSERFHYGPIRGVQEGLI